MSFSQSHNIEISFVDVRAAEAVAWLFANVEVFQIEEFLKAAGYCCFEVKFIELEDAAKFKMMFGDDDTDNTA